MSSGNANNLPKQILIIDDDSTVGQSMEGPLSGYDVSVVSSQDLETAFYHFNNQDFDVVFVELEFEGLHGLALMQKFRTNDHPEKRAAAFVVMSGKVRPASDDNLIKELLDVQLIVKPFSLIQILPYLSRGLANKHRVLKVEHFRDSVIETTKAGNLEGAVDTVKKNLPSLGNRGIQIICELYEIAGKFEEGLDFITPVAEKERGTILFQYLRGRFLQLLGRLAEAKTFLEEAYKSSPHHVKRLKELSTLYVDLMEPENAVSRMKELIKLNPEQPDLKFELFKDLEDKGFAEEAQKFCRETTAPMEVVRYYNNKGVEHSRRGDLDAAIKEYERALQYFPKFKENYRIHYNIALAQIKLKSWELAIQNLQKCLQLVPDFDKAAKALDAVRKNA